MNFTVCGCMSLWGGADHSNIILNIMNVIVEDGCETPGSVSSPPASEDKKKVKQRKCVCAT